VPRLAAAALAVRIESFKMKLELSENKAVR